MCAREPYVTGWENGNSVNAAYMFFFPQFYPLSVIAAAAAAADEHTRLGANTSIR